MWLLTSSVLLALGQFAAADVHHLFASAYRSPHLFALEYDTATNNLKEIARFSAHAGHPWLSWGFDRQTLYGAERDGWSSYQITANNELTFQSNLTLRGRCDGGDYKHGTTSVIAEQRSPYNVYGAGRSPCGNVMSSRVDGSLDRIVQNITYQPSSRVHGMALDSENRYLYSADTKANGIWTHQVDPVKGTLTRARFKAHSEPNARPRRLVLHPNSNILYVLLSKLNKVVVYSIKMDTAGPQLTETGLSYNLVPPGVNSSNYRGTELALSADNDVLYVTSRYRVQRRKDREEDNEGEEEGDEEGEDDEDERVGALFDEDDSRFVRKDARKQHMSKRQWPWGTSAPKPAEQQGGPTVLEPGFLTAIQLTPSDGTASSAPRTGAKEPGYPIQILLQVSTSTSGGRSNSITPAHWGNQYVVLTDSEKGLVQVWRFDGLEGLPRDAPPVVVQPQQPPVAPQPQPAPQPAPQPQPKPQPPQPQQPQNPRPQPSLTLPGQSGWGQVLQPANQPASNPRPPNPRPSPWVVPSPSSNPGWAPNPYGTSKRNVGRQQRQLANIRANIVAEWMAPPETVGQGDPAAPRGSNQQNDDSKGKTPGWGRGCCANAVWYD